MIIRNMKKGDAKSVAEIEQMVFSMPWSEKGILDFFGNTYSRFFVSEKDDEIIGYIGAYIVADEMDITNIAVKNQYQRMGIGMKLMEKVMEEARNENCSSVNLEVRESNNNAIKLYEKMGFKRVGIRKNFYSRPTENAIFYRYEFL